MTRNGTPVALQRTDRFVARTMNWLYDHLRALEGYRPVVLTGALENRREFPQVEARLWPDRTLPARVYRRLTRRAFAPGDVRWVRALRPRVLHSHFGYVAIGDRDLAEQADLPWLVGFYGADVYMHGRVPAWRERYGRLFPRMTRVLALGPAMAEALEEMGCPREKIVIHPLGVATDGVPFAERTCLPREPLQVLFAGTFREKKGLIYLMEAAGHLLQRRVPFHLHVIASPGARPDDRKVQAEVEEAVGRLGLEDHVTLEPFIPFADLMQLALRCHVFAAPSVRAEDGDAEGTPFVIQQMMLSGMAVVATRHSDVPFLFGPRAGDLLPERDARAIADRLEAYANEPERIRRDGLDNRVRMTTAFDVRHHAAALGRLYAQVGG